MTSVSASDARPGQEEADLQAVTATAATDTQTWGTSPGWQLLELFKSADSISQLKHISPDDIYDALYDYDTNVYIPLQTYSLDNILPVSWSSTFDQQLQLLLGATSNVLRLYPQTEDAAEALDFAPTLDILLLRVTELAHAACHRHVDIAKEQAAYQQRQLLCPCAMAVLQLLDVLKPLGELHCLAPEELRPVKCTCVMCVCGIPAMLSLLVECGGSHEQENEEHIIRSQHSPRFISAQAWSHLCCQALAGSSLTRFGRLCLCCCHGVMHESGLGNAYGSCIQYQTG
jgi:hypothetical protein